MLLKSAASKASPLRRLRSRRTREGVEAPRSARDVEARLAAIAVDLLGPDDARTVVLKRPVVLRAALQKVLRALRARRQTLELQRRQAVVHVHELVRHPIEE